MFIRHLRHGVGHQQHKQWQEGNTEMDANSEGNEDDTDEIDECKKGVDDEDDESEGEVELISESGDDDGSNNGCDCDSDNLGYASF